MRLIAAALAMMLATSAMAQTVSVGGLTIDFAADAMRPRTEAHKAFVSAYLGAVASGKPDAVRALVHPASLACAASEAGRDYLALVHARDVTRRIPADARVVVMPFDRQKFPFFWTELTALPIEPSDIFGLDFSVAEHDASGSLVKHSGTTIVRLLAPSDSRLHLLEHCLTTKGEQMFLARQAGSAPKSDARPPKP